MRRPRLSKALVAEAMQLLDKSAIQALDQCEIDRLKFLIVGGDQPKRLSRRQEEFFSRQLPINL